MRRKKLVFCWSSSQVLSRKARTSSPEVEHGGVDGDDEILDFARLARFQRLDQRHIAVAAQTVGVVAVVERVCVDGSLLRRAENRRRKAR